MESQTPRGPAVTHQRVQALSRFHVRDVNVMVDMSGSHEIPKMTRTAIGKVFNIACQSLCNININTSTHVLITLYYLPVWAEGQQKGWARIIRQFHFLLETQLKSTQTSTYQYQYCFDFMNMASSRNELNRLIHATDGIPDSAVSSSVSCPPQAAAGAAEIPKSDLRALALTRPTLHSCSAQPSFCHCSFALSLCSRLSLARPPSSCKDQLLFSSI